MNTGQPTAARSTRARRRKKAAGLGSRRGAGDAVDRRGGVEGTGGADFGDADLGDQEVGAAAHAEPDDVARPDAAPDEPAGDGVRRLVVSAVGEAALAEVRATRSGCSRALAEKFSARTSSRRRSGRASPARGGGGNEGPRAPRHSCSTPLSGRMAVPKSKYGRTVGGLLRREADRQFPLLGRPLDPVPGGQAI